MEAMVLDQHQIVDADSAPLRRETWPDPTPGPDDVLLQVTVCGVCHTELDEIEGRTPPPQLPVVLGHQVVGRVVARGANVTTPKLGDRVGVAWIFSACGDCDACRRGEENLCPGFQATGRDANGGYAELMVAPAAFTYPIPPQLDDANAAPLLCAGAIGYRSLRLTNLQDGQSLGLTGFGASAHLVLELVRYRLPQTPVFVFARSPLARAFALDLGAVWAGETAERAPVQLDAIIDTTPAWKPVLEGLANLVPGGRLVINAIRKEDHDQEQLLRLDYAVHLWQEKEIKSVANVTRRDVVEFLDLAAAAGITPTVDEYPLAEANCALTDMRTKPARGAKVLRVHSG